MKLKNLSVLTLAFVCAACQPSAPTASNVQNTSPSPTASATAPSVVSNSENANATSANVKSNQATISPSPTVSATPKATASPTVAPASKYKNYTVEGVVKGIDAEKSSITIDHEDIGDYMIAMEMPFPVVNKDSLKNLKIGDQVEFVLETGVGVERIIKIRKK